jgi:hypothetical protein
MNVEDFYMVSGAEEVRSTSSSLGALKIFNNTGRTLHG